MCIDFKILKVQVPIIFPAHRAFRHAGIDVSFEGYLVMSFLESRTAK